MLPDLATISLGQTIDRDAIGLSIVMEQAGAEISSAAKVAADLYRISHPINRGTLASAKAASLRVLTQISEYEKGIR